MKLKTTKGSKGPKDVEDIFPDLESFKQHVQKVDKNIRYDNEQIIQEIKRLYSLLKTQEGEIYLSRIRGWLVENYSFKTTKWGNLEYWLERGWTEESALIELKKRNNEIKQRNRLCIEYWINKGYSEEEGLKIISEAQSRSSKFVVNNQGKSKKMLREKGYTEEEITEICLTPANIKFWIKKGYSEEDAIEMVSKNAKYAASCVDPEKVITSTKLVYWTNMGYTEEEAIKLRSERQSTFSLSKCIEKYGEDEGVKRFNDRQLKWQKSLSSGGNLKIGYSAISQKLFYEILDHYDVIDKSEIFFATHNKEYVLEKENGGVWLYDFTDLKNKKIIEYHGDDYHGNPKKYKADDYPNPFRKDLTAQEIWDKDKRKFDIAYKHGFEILTIWDSEYRWGNKQEIIDKCLIFLNKK